MRYLWSAAVRHAATPKTASDTQIYSHRQMPRDTSAFFLAIIAPILLFISGCSPEDASVQVKNKQSELERQQQDVAAIQDNIQNSYAHLAAKRSDVCPKLIQQRIDSKTIKRTAEVMTGDYCDYFFYPRVGEQISVSLNNDQVEALLIIPLNHNFKNGSYHVTTYDKHVIRLTYDGATYKPENFSYDVAITVSDEPL